MHSTLMPHAPSASAHTHLPSAPSVTITLSYSGTAGAWLVLHAGPDDSRVMNFQCAYYLEHMHQLSLPEILRTLDTSAINLTDDFAAKTANLQSPALSDKESVVYSYGMVMLEMMSGRFMASEGGLLEGWAASFLRGKRQLRNVMDPGQSMRAKTMVDRFDGVIRSCTDQEVRRRPTMPEVARRLKEITAMPPDAATPKASPLWWAELEIKSTEAT